MNKQTLNAFIIHTILILVMNLLMISCGSKGYVDIGVTETKLSDSEASVVADVITKLKTTKYWHPELEGVFIESANKEKLKEHCGGPNMGCTDTIGIMLIESHPAFCDVLAHEFQHIIKHIETGDGDASHSDTHAFYQWPSQFCSDIANPFVKTSACLNPILCRGSNA